MKKWPPSEGIPPMVERPVNSAAYGSVSYLGLRFGLDSLPPLEEAEGGETKVVSEVLGLAMTVDLDDLRKSENILVIVVRLVAVVLGTLVVCIKV